MKCVANAVLATVAMFVLVLEHSPAHSQQLSPPAFCNAIADYAIVARALALEPSVSGKSADAILGRIYIENAQFNEGVKSKVRARARAHSELSAGDFANQIGSECAASRGDPQFLGRDS